jgi:hypothetical protein
VKCRATQVVVASRCVRLHRGEHAHAQHLIRRVVVVIVLAEPPARVVVVVLPEPSAGLVRAVQALVEQQAVARDPRLRRLDVELD